MEGMQTPDIFIAYAPRGAGLRCAVAYLATQRDVYGWFTGPRDDAHVASAFFLLEDFYTIREPRYDAVDFAQVRSDWSLDPQRRHELAEMQAAFAREWLVSRDDPQIAAYNAAELAVGEVNVRYECLARFSKLQPNWTYYSPGFERPVLEQLAKRWPLEYRPEPD